MIPKSPPSHEILGQKLIFQTFAWTIPGRFNLSITPILISLYWCYFIFRKHLKANLQLGGLEKEKCFLKIMEGTRYKLFIQTGTTIGAGTDSVGKISNDLP